MSDQERPDGWGAVPHTDDLRGDRTAQGAQPQRPATEDDRTQAQAGGPAPAHPQPGAPSAAQAQPGAPSAAQPQPSAPGQAHPQPSAPTPAHPQGAPTPQGAPAPQGAPTPQGASAPYGAPPRNPYAQYHPTPRATRRRLGRKGVIGIVAGAAALLLVVIGGSVAYASGSAAHSPTHQVDAFLGHLESGDVDAALDDAGVRHGKSDVLLTDAAYREATGRITGHEVVQVQTDSDSATVDVYLRQRGRTVPTTFHLTRTGTDAGIFPVWELDPVSLGAVDVLVRGPARSTIVIAGQRVKTSTDGAVKLKALPGTYEVGVDGDGWYTSEQKKTEVSGFGGAATSSVDLAATLTDKGAQAAEAAVNGWVDQCAASTSIVPPGCSFSAYGEDPANTYTNEKWTLDARPVFDVGDWIATGWTVRTSTAGSATFTADFTGPAGTGAGKAGPVDVWADGSITGFTSQGATFVASAASSDSGETGT